MSHFPPPPYAQPDMTGYNDMNQIPGYGPAYNRTPVPRFAGPMTPNYVSTPVSIQQDDTSFQNYLSPYRTIPNPMGSMDGMTDPSFMDESSGNIEYRDMSNSQLEFQPYTSFRNTEHPPTPGYYRDPYGMPGYPNEPLPNPMQNVYVGAPVRFPKRFPPETQGNQYRPRNPFPKRPFNAGKRPHSQPTVRNPPPVFYCELCKVSCAGPLAFKDHEAGQRHKKRLSQTQAVERSKQSTDGQSTPAVPASGGAKELRCELCEVVCTGVDAYNAHTAGKQHQRTLKLHKELGKPIPDTQAPVIVSIPTNGDTKPKEKKKKKEGASAAAALELAAMIRDVTPIGVEYVEAVLGNNGKAMHYRCKLCDCQFTSADAKEAHVRGRRHRIQFKKKVDPSLEITPRQGSQQLPKPIAGHKRPLETGGGDLNDFTLSIGSLGMFPPRDGNTPLRGNSNFGRFPCTPVFPGRLSAAQIPNAAAENRYIAVKHTSLVPTPAEFNAVKSAVNVCERALKEISDKLYEETCSVAPKDDSNSNGTKPSDASQPTDSDDAKKDASDTDDAPEPSDPETQSPNQQFAEGEYRLLSGVIRVGPLGKGLMLKGEHAADLALVCSYRPTVELLNFVASKLSATMRSLDSRLTYTVTPEPSMGQIVITSICPDPSLMLLPNSSDQQQQQDVSQKPSATPAQTAVTSSTTSSNETNNMWPEITIRLHLTSPAVVDQSTTNDNSNNGSNANGSTEDQSKIPHVHALIKNGHPLDLQHCLKALDMINHTKWFQAVGSKGPMRIVCRIFRDYLQSNDYWIEMDEAAVFDHLERLLNTEWYFSFRASQTPRPFGGLSHPGLVPRAPPTYATAFKNVTGSANSYLSPCVLMRRFFESIASGLLLLLPEPPNSAADLKQSDSDQSGAAERKVKPTMTGEFPDNRPQFIPSSLVSGLSLATKEKITASAQQAVRLMAFKQLHKILNMQPFVPQSVLLAQSKTDDSESQPTDQNDPSKRRRIETESLDENAKTNGGTGTSSIKADGETTQQQQPTATPSQSAPDPVSAKEEQPAPVPTTAKRVTRYSRR